MVGEAVIVLHDVEAGPREGEAEGGEPAGVESHRLERRGKERAAGNAGECAEARNSRAGTGKPIEGLLGELDVGEDHVGPERAVAEENVEELRGVGGRRGERMRDNDSKDAGVGRFDTLDAAEHLGNTRESVTAARGSSDRLLQHQGLGARPDLIRGRTNGIGDAQLGVVSRSTG